MNTTPATPKHPDDVVFALFSDLHVESSGCTLNVQGADAVLLPGDIFAAGACDPNEDQNVISWIDQRLPRNIPIVFVPGNHDFEDSAVFEQMAAWKKVAARLNPDIHVLWNESVDILGVRVLGTPYFTDFAGTGNPKAVKDYAGAHVVDFKRVFSAPGVVVTPADYVTWNLVAQAWLHDELRKDLSMPKLVATHFAATRLGSSPAFQALESAYWSSRHDDLVALADVWVHGHTHHCIDTVLSCATPGFGRVVSNARGRSKLYNLSSDPNYRDPKLVVVNRARIYSGAQDT